MLLFYLGVYYGCCAWCSDDSGDGMGETALVFPSARVCTPSLSVLCSEIA